jgi:hypothetical protein
VSALLRTRAKQRLAELGITAKYESKSIQDPLSDLHRFIDFIVTFQNKSDAALARLADVDGYVKSILQIYKNLYTVDETNCIRWTES